jgi:Domain of unknown function (DUF4365)
MLAASAGFGIARPLPDVAGIDFHIVGLSEVEDDYPLAKVQVKSWSDPRGDDISLYYRGLNEKQFNVLAGTRVVPAFLFVIVVPHDSRDYARIDDQQLHLSHAGYWMSLANRPKFPDPSSDRSVPIHIPRKNLLTVESLTALCNSSVSGAGPLARTS